LALPSPVPHRDVFELSVFGAGIGECLVLHVGGSEWVVVDSCLNPKSRRPVALEYLEELGVSRQQVLLVAASHWHDDHIRGLSEVVNWATGASFVFSEALKAKEFLGLIAASELETSAFSSGIGEFSKILQAKQKRVRGRVIASGLQYAIADRLIRKFPAVSRPTQVRVFSLSPSDQTITACLTYFASLMQGVGQPRRRIPDISNEASVVLYITGGATSILLGGDLEHSTAQETGWNAVADCHSLTSKARVFKVPHHGSPNGDADVIWSKLLVDRPVAVLTPFLAGTTPRPTIADLTRLASKSSRLFVAGGQERSAPRRRENAVEKQMREVARRRRELGSRLGHVRIRFQIGGSTAPMDCYCRWLASEYTEAASSNV